MNAAAVTAIRTAAVSAVASRPGQEDAGDLRSSGPVSRRSHLAALVLVRKIRRIRVASRLRARAGLATTCEAASRSRPCPRRRRRYAARISWSATSAASRCPPGSGSRRHISTWSGRVARPPRGGRPTMAAARVFVDRRESENEAGDYGWRSARVRPPDHIRAELDVLIGAAPAGRAPTRSRCPSLGLAVEDLWSAAHVYERARGRRRHGGGLDAPTPLLVPASAAGHLPGAMPRPAPAAASPAASSRCAGSSLLATSGRP
jgi:hypothetical protein